MEHKLILKEKIYQGHTIDLSVDHLLLDGERKVIREVVEHPGGTVIIPILPNGDIMLIQQYRYPFNKEIIELPAGKFDEGENPLRCAKRELQEETGYGAVKWMRLGSLMSTPGFSNEVLHIFMALNIEPTGKGQSLEEGEEYIRLKPISLHEAVTMVEREEITDAKSIIGILYAERFFRKISE
jgi:ADP-ribose pyrophosphatase